MNGLRHWGVLAGLCLSALFLSACQKAPPPWDWNIPEGFPAPSVPEDNPMTAAKVELGRHLFYDRNLSANQVQSCANCHQQQFAFSEPLPHSNGSTGDKVRRNSMPLVNVAYNAHLTWAHTELTTLETQILIPMFSEEPIELGITGHEESVLARFDNDKYRPMFAAAFPGEDIGFELIVQAISSFVRNLTSFNSPFDRYAYYGEDDALSEAALRGMDLFFSERLECHHCHGGFNFSQASKHADQAFEVTAFHNTGLYNVDGEGAYPQSDQGLKEITLQPQHMGQFRAPTLRNIAVTAPYMHDGSVATLEEVIAIYAAGGRGEGINSPLKSPFMHGFVLSDQDMQDLLAFLESLTDEAFLNNPEFAAPEY
ncbi:MbnH family di-heme enzyme [Planctobacterium marinum]|uniref:Di-heme enzyme n=1 Tax=Planctobacterium marinum TaxID=1631968 RepID=A0AA48I6R8_9ALTE|nr:di-heme enzyme [Planctobacterium marinum]